MKKLLVLACLVLAGAGCTSSVDVSVTPEFNLDSALNLEIIGPGDADFPVENYVDGRTFKAFGEYIEDRFTGYHVGDDVEVVNFDGEVPVYAITDGEIIVKDVVDGYGGVLVIDHNVQEESVKAIYGHLDIDSIEKGEGDNVERGEVIANLGDHESDETDGERKHLHFAVYQGNQIRLQGYESSLANVDTWMNPQDLFKLLGVDATSSARAYSPDVDLGGEDFNIRFRIPEGWELEYVPSIQSLNLFAMNGSGTARDRSQMFIRFFDASDFLTLNTVEIYSTEDLTVGQGYVARQYDIEKKDGIADFAEQPSWRNDRHIVTDFRGAEGQTRYFVVAANPDVDPELYEHVLNSMEIVE